MKNRNHNPKILLALLPFWDPLIPPAGLSCLKGFLTDHGFGVKTIDGNVEASLKEIYHLYFDRLKKEVPREKHGNFYKIGHDVLRNHMLAYLNCEDKKDPDYLELIEELVYKTFYVKIGRDSILELDGLLAGFFQGLGDFILAHLEREQPGVLGISVFSDSLPASLYAFRLAKAKYPHIKTVMGGGVFATDLAPGSPNLGPFLESAPYIDHLFVGEGEILFLEYLNGNLDPTQRVYTLDNIDRKTIDVTAVGVPDFSDFVLHHYPYLMAYTSRSCPYQCSFCAETVHWGRYRKKTAPQVAGELENLHRRHGSWLFLMSDSLLNPVLAGLVDEIPRTGLPLYWDGYVRVDHYLGDPANTLALRQAGFYRARLGIESGSPRVLELMDKKVTLDQVEKTLSSLAYAGIKTTTYWVIGFPGETEEDFLQTLALLEERADDIYEADCSPFWYFPSALSGSGQWGERALPLYTAKKKQLLTVQTWQVDCEPHREEIYARMWRFVAHCHKLGIPNPYSLEGIVAADRRWKELHRNAVPSLVELNGRERPVDEAKNIRKLVVAEPVSEDEEGDFDF